MEKCIFCLCILIEKCIFKGFKYIEKCIFMLKRKIQKVIEQHFINNGKVLLIDGARQIGKSYIVRYVGRKMFSNYIEINLQEDFQGKRIFADVNTLDDFYLQLSAIAGTKMGTKNNTLVFLDEIQVYPQLLTLLKFLNQDGRFSYVVSGSQLGIALQQTTSIPLGNIEMLRMYPLDFEEFLWANGVSEEAISAMRQKFDNREALNESLHTHILNLWKRYLLVGGLPEVVNKYLETTNIVVVRKTQSDIHAMYGIDASKYDVEHKLKIRRIYDLIPSNMENKKKRVVIQSIENKKGKRTSDYVDEFDFLINSGIALEVKAISNPKFPLIESAGKNLLKLYLNDVGLLTNLLYRNNINAILGDERSVNLGSVYESVVAQELRTHDNNLFYYDNKVRGEVDFLIDDYDLLSVVPIEVKSGKDYTVHSALNLFVSNDEYSIKQGIVLSNERDVFADGKIIYMPIYYVMFLQQKKVDFIKI